jgi:co-chaperonin GroES (HSP10)
MLKPTRGQVVLEKVELPAEIIVATKEQGYEKGRVVASAADGVTTGDTVLFTTYGPVSVRHEGNEYVIARREDIFSIIT